VCVLCGYGLSPYDWAEAPAPPSGAPAAEEGSAQRDARRARLARVQICDAVLADWGVRVRTATGREYVLSDRKGRTRIARTLGELWDGAAALADRPLDPLDPDLLARLAR
jgi:hypothetical protein